MAQYNLYNPAFGNVPQQQVNFPVPDEGEIFRSDLGYSGNLAYRQGNQVYALDPEDYATKFNLSGFSDNNQRTNAVIQHLAQAQGLDFSGLKSYNSADLTQAFGRGTNNQGYSKVSDYSIFKTLTKQATPDVYSYPEGQGRVTSNTPPANTNFQPVQANPNANYVEQQVQQSQGLQQQGVMDQQGNVPNKFIEVKPDGTVTVNPQGGNYEQQQAQQQSTNSVQTMGQDTSGGDMEYLSLAYSARPDLQALYNPDGTARDINDPRVAGIPTLVDWARVWGSQQDPKLASFATPPSTGSTGSQNSQSSGSTNQAQTTAASNNGSTGAGGVVPQTQSPVNSFSQKYQEIITSMGLTDIKNRILETNKEIEKIDNKKAEELREINDNPFLSNAAKIKKMASKEQEYEKKKESFVARKKLDEALYAEGREDARFIASQQWQLDETLMLRAMDTAEEKVDAAIKFAIDNNVTQPFYKLGNTMYRTADRKLYKTPEEFFKDGGARDFKSNVTDLDALAGGGGDEVELDTFTNASGQRVSVMYNKQTKQTREVIHGSAQDKVSFQRSSLYDANGNQVGFQVFNPRTGVSFYTDHQGNKINFPTGGRVGGISSDFTDDSIESEIDAILGDG